MKNLKRNAALRSYIVQARKAGVTDSEIIKNLTIAGWDKDLVSDQFALATSDKAKLAPRLGVRHRRRTPLKWKKITRWVVGAGLVGGLSAWFLYMAVISNRHLAPYSLLGMAIKNSVESFTAGGNSIEVAISYQDATSVEARLSGQKMRVPAIDSSARGTANRENLFLSADGKTWVQISIAQYQELLSARLVNRVEFLGFQGNGKSLRVRYRLTLDELALRQLLLRFVPHTTFGTLGVESVAEAVHSVARSVQLKTLEVEVDPWRGKITSVHGEANFASPWYMLGQSLKHENVDQIADAKSTELLARILEIKNALQKFQEQHGGFPENAGGTPAGIVPVFLPEWPAGSSSNSCPGLSKNFAYVAEGLGKKKGKTTVFPGFSVQFCLETPVLPYEAGLGFLTPTGIITQSACPGQEGKKCFVPPTEVSIDTAGQMGTPRATLKLNFSFKPSAATDTMPKETSSILEWFNSQLQRLSKTEVN